MSTKTKIWLITGLSLMIVGAIIFTGVMMALNWDFNNLSTVKYETKNYEITEDFSDILLKTDTSKIVFKLSSDGKNRVECFEEKNAKHSVSVVDNILKIELSNTKKWYEYIGINFKSPSITLYLNKNDFGKLNIKESTGDIQIPKDFNFTNIDISLSTGDVATSASSLGNIKIKTSTGDIKIENIIAHNIDLTASTGKITAKNIKADGDISVKLSTGKAHLLDIICKNLISKANTGDIKLLNVIAKEKFSIERSTGDVEFKKSDAAEIFIKTDTGSVTGSLLTDKIFITKTDTGSVDVPESLNGGKCEIITDTGNIKIILNKNK